MLGLDEVRGLPSVREHSNDVAGAVLLEGKAQESIDDLALPDGAGSPMMSSVIWGGLLFCSSSRSVPASRRKEKACSGQRLNSRMQSASSGGSLHIRRAALCDDGAQVMAASSSLWGCHAGRGDDSAGLPHFFVDLMQH